MRINRIDIIAATLAVIVGLAILWTTGCDPARHYSEQLSEDATVEDSFYTPPTHGSGTGLTVGKSGVKPTFVTVDVEPVYGLLFHCAHGQFVIQGSDDRHKQLWERLPKGKAVTVFYREVYTGTGEQQHLIKYDFLDAQIKETL